MFRKHALTILLFALVLFISGAAFSLPDLSASSVRMPNIGEETPVLFVLPNGEGVSFTNARALGTGEIVDATIELTLVDYFGAPITDYPLEELSLGSPDGDFDCCILGGAPDEDTNINGVTYWSSPIRAFGSNNGVIQVLVNYSPVTGDGAPLSLMVNSPDLNGDGVVNLADVNMFSEVFFGAYDFSADYFPDGVVDLADVAGMAQGLGASCP